MMIKSLIIKCIRACNLRCNYCYYINEQTPHYGMVMSNDIIEKLYQTYSKYMSANTKAVFAWHGGEPLMIGIKRFQSFIDLQKKYFGSNKISNVIQSNGLLINEKWIKFFKKNDISIGISIDGLRENHDQNRVTISKKGTFLRTVRAFQLLNKHGIDVGVLSVVNSKSNGEDTIKFFRNIGVKSLDFLLPITNHSIQRLKNNEKDLIDINGIGTFLNQAFRKWIELDDDKFDVRIFEALVFNAFGVKTKFQYTGPSTEDLLEYVIIETDGNICIDEEYGEIDRYDLGNENKLGFNLFDKKFSFDMVESKLRNTIERRKLGQLPDACQTCDVKIMCRGSHPGSRFDSKNNSYNNPSVYCDAMYNLCELILKHISKNEMMQNIKDPILRAKAANLSLNELV